MKTNILTLLLIFGLVSVQTKITAEQAVEVIAGIMDGVILKDDLKELSQCMTDVQDDTDSINQIANDFSSLTLTGILSGIEEFRNLMIKLRGDLTTCECIRPDVDKFLRWGEIFIEPSILVQQLENNLPAHLNEIISDIQAANADYTQQNFFEFGENIGEALVLAVGQNISVFAQ
ncbi:UNKNOWN [Stylonychia lemnae]|uniref:Uncharacterized protein n=1 Tax=Stylonychia lemnae TaxID=5949 RepID=A0A077ZTK5_STYLE|nr:UNKNOWN [Stylonychia lemnae]|eukprot:CDW71791.1 UNKNOWN [Stylonychia lemnae]